MALFDQSYTAPGVYTTVVLNSTAAPLFGNALIPVLIGEGLEYFTVTNKELHRGSSATADDQVVQENLSAQVDGITRTFQLSHYPVVSGNGTGTVTNDYSKIKVSANGNPVTVISLVGATGQFTTQTLVPLGTNLTASYYFKKTDTLISNEDLSYQIPTFASLTVNANLVLSLTVPGASGNDVSFGLTLATSGSGVSDANAVTGAGTNDISIELMQAGPGAVARTWQQVATLAGITPTQSGGYLKVTSVGGGTPSTAFAAANFTGGAGPNTNTTFKTKNVPIVDGTNGGVTTTDIADVTVKMNGSAVAVAAVDGAHGLITLVNPVLAGASLSVTYYTNTYQNTSDLLPNANVASIVNIGLSPDDTNYIQGVDYALVGNSVVWGAAAVTAAKQSTPGYTPLDATTINTTLVDTKVYNVPVNGTVNGNNTVFNLKSSPMDGSGLGRPTDNPALVQISVGPNPTLAAPVAVAKVSGATATVTLFNPPQPGNQVFATYYSSLIADHTYTLTVDNPGTPGQGTYSIEDELGRNIPVAALTSFPNVVDSVLWPNNFSDLRAIAGAADEVITLTFQADDLGTATTPATQASATYDSKLLFTATTPGNLEITGNAVTVQFVNSGSGSTDADAIQVNGNALTVDVLEANGTTVRTWAQVLALFNTYPENALTAGGGVIRASAVALADLTTQATTAAAFALTGGTSAIVTNPYANRFLVTSSRTAAQAQADGLGLTGGATTPSGANTTLGATGYLGQTYIDALTGVQFTIVDPALAVSYGYDAVPANPRYIAGQVITLTIGKGTGIGSEPAWTTGATPIIGIPGLQTQVVTTYGMNGGDTATIQTMDNSTNEPAVGDFYYVTYTYAKQASDFTLKTFNSKTDAYAAYGTPNTVNRLSLAVQFLTGNGAQQFACIQVPAQTGLPVASDQAFIDAIATLTKPLPGGTAKVNVIVPLSTSATVQQYLGQFLSTQAGPRNKGEATAFIGFDQFATANSIRQTATAIANRRVVALGPSTAGVMIQGPTDQQAVEYQVTGEFLAAAAAGLLCNPNIDVATTLTGMVLTGFSRLINTWDEPTMNLAAQSGVCVLVEDAGGILLRHYKTTDPSNDLTSEPTVTTTADYLSRQFRGMLKQFTGRKMVSDLPSSIQAVCNAAMLNNYTDQLINAYQPVSVTQDANPMTLDIGVSYLPMWSLLWQNVTFTVNLNS